MVDDNDNDNIRGGGGRPWRCPPSPPAVPCHRCACVSLPPGAVGGIRPTPPCLLSIKYTDRIHSDNRDNVNVAMREDVGQINIATDDADNNNNGPSPFMSLPPFGRKGEGARTTNNASDSPCAHRTTSRGCTRIGLPTPQGSRVDAARLEREHPWRGRD